MCCMKRSNVEISEKVMTELDREQIITIRTEFDDVIQALKP